MTRTTHRARFSAALQREKRAHASLRSDQPGKWPRSTSAVPATSSTPVGSSSLALIGSTTFIELAPCDVMMADIQVQTPDTRAIAFLEICRSLDGELI